MIKELEDDPEVVKTEVRRVLTQEAKQVRICTRCKNWWNASIAENTNIWGFMKRDRRGDRTNHASMNGTHREKNQVAPRTYVSLGASDA
jgi:hypothetical protein